MNPDALWDWQEESKNTALSHRDNGYGFSAPPRVAILGHKMGQGKTPITLEVVEDFVMKQGKRIIFLVPGNTMIQWQKLWDKWVLECEPDEFGSTSLHKVSSSTERIPNGVSIVLSHNLFSREGVAEKLANMNFDGIVVDEIHKFGSRDTKRIHYLWALINLTPSHFEECRLGLTGTFVQNYAKEAYNLAHFVDPLRFRTFEDFARKYLTYDRKALANPKQFHSDFAPYYIRPDVDQKLPPLRCTKLYTEITDPLVRMAYNKNVDLLTNYMNHAGKIEAFSLLGYLVKLRHITGLAKAKEPAIIEPIKDWLDEGNRAVIGLHHHYVYDRLHKSLEDYPSILIRGGITPEEKYKRVQDFIKSAPNTVCYLGIKAAGEGTDGLQHAANKAYIFERQWNGQTENQFITRILRTGQTKPVHIEYTIATGTVDEFFDEMCVYKDRIAMQVEDVDYETNPRFLQQLAERVISSRLPEITKADLKLMDQMGIKFDIEQSIQDQPSL
jgi:SNF2 family DNA or RNA helicase